MVIVITIIMLGHKCKRGAVGRTLRGKGDQSTLHTHENSIMKPTKHYLKRESVKE
jgi:hypothetical protein